MKNKLGGELNRKRMSLKHQDAKWTQEFTATQIPASGSAYIGWELGTSRPTGLYKAAVHKFLSTSNRKLKKEAGDG